MSRVIAGIYEIQEQIGSGGGGTVYRGRHLRLEKQVVLKADKRTIHAKPESLRREVDMLKGLSHRYIPQVYDFVQEDGVVYTVMDFIEGESLDKLLGRNRLPSQPQLIKWACQLLEALSYLHSRPPHGILHGDIKPANIMLRPDGDICLIDYNIALALGENGAVKAGFSRGYASPEHYGSDNGGAAETVTAAEETRTLNREAVTTVTAAQNLLLSGGSGKSSQQGVMLDVRSDIYSLGATLYHLLSGKRPAQEAVKVEPLAAGVCSPEVSAIISKAMAPDPGLRFQSAEEMLTAFLQLHRCDRRAVRHRRRILSAAAALAVIFLAGGGCAFTGLKQLEQLQTALTLAEYSADALAKGDVQSAVKLALQALPAGKNFWEAPAAAQAQKALTDALGVYDLSDGFKALETVALPSAPMKLAVSPEGSRFAAVYAYEAAVFDMNSRQRLVTLPLRQSALSDLIFLDETHLVFAGADGVTAYDLNARKVMWTGEAATTLAVSGNGTMVAAADREQDRAVIYRVSDGAKIKERSFEGRYLQAAANDIFADPGGTVFALNEAGSRLAVSFAGGGLTIFDLADRNKDLTIYQSSDFDSFQGGFCSSYFAFAAGKSGEALFGLIDTEEGVYLDGYHSREPVLLQADGHGIYLAEGNLLVGLDPDTLKETELAYTGNADITGFSVGDGYVLAATEDNGFSFYDSGANLLSSESSKENCDFVALAGGYAVVGNRNEPSLRLLELENHREAQLFSYDARYPHDEARISRDGRTAMLFHYRGFRIYDRNGNMVKEAALPDPEQIYDQQFVKSADGSWLEVTWYDGTVRRFSAADGRQLSRTAGEAPQTDLYEEFYTDRYKIVSSLHEAPRVYELGTGKPAGILEEEAYLTYVTQAGEYILTEYISAAGERYGLLLDQELQTRACLPGLCDMADGMPVFDYGSGNLRQCRLYSLQELIALGEAMK